MVRCTNCEQVQPNTDSPICEALRDKGSALILFSQAPSSVAKSTQRVLSILFYLFFYFFCLQYL